ncbi:MAG TPA: hypothetical protein VLY23_13075 [Candidatus Acidoferrum sp.]|nr:hypothetical protein [Candidatus Acidoferrum sp.]
MKMTDDGSLLTADGWKQAGVLFLHPTPQPQHPTLRVIWKNYAVSLSSTNGDRAVVYVGYTDLGQIDSRLHYIPFDPTIAKSAAIFHMVLANGQWKIEDPQDWPWASLDAAMRHVKEMRRKAVDPTIQKNADATLDILAKFRG